MPPLSEVELDESITLVNQHYVSQGITSVQNASLINDYKRWQTCHRLQEAGKLKSRIYLMCGVETIREVIAFPKNKAGISLMDNAPSEVSERQLKELSLKLDIEKLPQKP